MMTGGSSPGGDVATSPGNNDELSLLVDDVTNSTTTTTNVTATDDDPWALLAAAADDRENKDSGVTTTTMPTTMTHTEGEVFTLPPGLSSPIVDDSSLSSSAITIPPFLASIATRLHDVDKQYLNLSTKIQELDNTYQLTNKISQYNHEVIKPATARTIEQTSIAAVNVRERASAISAQLSESVLRITEEHQKQQRSSATTMATNNMENSDINDDRGKQWKEGIINIATPAKEKVFAGVNWLQQRILETRDRQQQQQEQQQQQQDYSTTTTSTSFARDAVELRQRRDEFS